MDNQNGPMAPVVPGSLPKEKADNIPINASQGEYMLPAEVVRWHGVKAINDMIAAAQKGYEGLQQTGQIKPQAPQPKPMQPPQGAPKPTAAPQPQKPPMAPTGAQKPGSQTPVNPVSQAPVAPMQRPGMADGGLLTGAPAGATVQQRIMPDGRMIHVYVDAAGNVIGQPGSKTIGGGTDGGMAYQNSLTAETKKDEQTKPVGTSAQTNHDQATGHESTGGSPGGDADQGGPQTPGDNPDASPMEAVTAALGAIAAGPIGAVMGPIAEAEVKSGQLADKTKNAPAAVQDIVDLAEAAYGLGNKAQQEAAKSPHSIGSPGSGAASDGGSPAGGNSGGDQGNAGDGAGGTGAGSDAEGGGMGASGGVGGAGTDGAENYAQGGFIAPPGLNMRAAPVMTTGTSAPWLR